MFSLPRRSVRTLPAFLLIIFSFTCLTANATTLAHPDFGNSKPGNVKCKGKAYGHAKNAARGRAYGRGDDCNVVENTPPTAEAGDDHEAHAGDKVLLDGGDSSDADGDELAYAWTQSAGTSVTLHDAATATASFTAPTLPADEALEFTLTVSDGIDESSDTVSITVRDGVAPAASVPSGETLGVNQPLEIHFNEAIDPASLELGDTLAEVDHTVQWNAAHDIATVTPVAGWESGQRRLSVTAADVAGNTMDTVEFPFAIQLVFENFQAASVVIGQPDFTTVNRDAAAPDNLGAMYPNAAYSREHDILFVPDMSRHRILGFYGIPSENQPLADFALGNDDLYGTRSTDPAARLDMPRGIQVADGKLLVSEQRKRVVIYDPLPQTGPGAIATVIGDEDGAANACDASNLTVPLGRWLTPDGKLIVSDRDNHRVLIWNELPASDAEPADLVLGQQDFTHCAANDTNNDGMSDSVSASTLRTPRGVWSNGEKLVIADNGNRRVLIWNTFPTTDFQPADIVLGQPSTTSAENRETAASTLKHFTLDFWSNGEQLILSDTVNNRVLIWNEWPTQHMEAADVVLGQSNFAMSAPNDDDQDGQGDATPSARTFSHPASLSVSGDKLFVSDFRNWRVLIFESN